LANSHNIFFPAEWEKQDAVLIAWPHQHTDWNYMLDEVTECYLNVAREISNDEPLVIITPNPDDVAERICELPHKERIHIVKINTNDTWARDFGPITTICNGTPIANDFKFNGWGLKFAADKDNLINKSLSQKGILKCNLRNQLNFVLEGGSIESDGNGTLMATSNCLLSPNRNGQMSKEEIDNFLKCTFGVTQVLWVDYGELQGDDTDSHIDTLARFAPNNTIVYTQCEDATDYHFETLEMMRHQISTFTNVQGEPYKLIALPLPKPIYDEDGCRLPATYANFLVTNHNVLMPTYSQPQLDNIAISNLQTAFPSHNVIGINCNALIKQHGSLHCITMQLPFNTTNI